jgi:hypothetical protein
MTDDDAPITLEAACKLWPGAKLTVDALMMEHRRGRLRVFQQWRDGKIRSCTTPNDMREMVRQARMKQQDKGRRESTSAEQIKRNTKTCLYRHFDRYGCLLYVGISQHLLLRQRRHDREAHWSDKITRIEVERFSSRKKALAAEAEAICNEQPLHNIGGRVAA